MSLRSGWGFIVRPASAATFALIRWTRGSTVETARRPLSGGRYEFSKGRYKSVRHLAGSASLWGPVT